MINIGVRFIITPRRSFRRSRLLLWKQLTSLNTSQISNHNLALDMSDGTMVLAFSAIQRVATPSKTTKSRSNDQWLQHVIQPKQRKTSCCGHVVWTSLALLAESRHSARLMQKGHLESKIREKRMAYSLTNEVSTACLFLSSGDVFALLLAAGRSDSIDSSMIFKW